MRLKNSKHESVGNLPDIAVDRQRSEICSTSHDVNLLEACPPPAASVFQLQKSYVKVSPFWRGQNLELDKHGCLWWEMSQVSCHALYQ